MCSSLNKVNWRICCLSSMCGKHYTAKACSLSIHVTDKSDRFLNASHGKLIAAINLDELITHQVINYIYFLNRLTSLVSIVCFTC